MARYGKKAASKVKRAMHERKHGTLSSGRSGKKVTSRKQGEARHARAQARHPSQRPLGPQGDE